MSIPTHILGITTTIRLEPLPGAPSNPPSKKQRDREALHKTALKHLKRFARKHKTPKPYVCTVECRISRMPDGKLRRLCDRKRARALRDAEWMRLADEAKRVHAARPAKPPERRGADEGLSDLFGGMTVGEDEGASTTRPEGDASSTGNGQYGTQSSTGKEETMEECLSMLDRMDIGQHESEEEQEAGTPMEEEDDGDEGYATAEPS